jgi:hypothetical protein
LSFDDHYIGLCKKGESVLCEQLIPRPEGMPHHRWYKFCASVIRHLNELDEKTRPVPRCIKCGMTLYSAWCNASMLCSPPFQHSPHSFNLDGIDEVEESDNVKKADPPEQLAEMQTVPDYRFGRLVKGEVYAYARGLTINPSHLPGALDAMLTDGWRLLSVFGQTDSENVGFIFERGAAETKPVGFDGTVDPVLKEAIRRILPNPILKALHSPDSYANFSSATLEKLLAAGLIDSCYRWNERGRALQVALGIIERGDRG